MYTLSATSVLSSLEELCIYAYVTTSNYPLECAIHKESIYIAYYTISIIPI